MKNILIVPNKNKDVGLKVSEKVAKLLSANSANVYVEEKYTTTLSNYAEAVSTVPEAIDLIIVIGGDGSVLDASVYAVEKKIPILGVNLGKLGYLAELDVDNVEMLSRLFTGEYTIEDKMLLEVSRVSNGKIHTSERLAVNDIIISHDTFLGIADFRLEKSDGECVRYRADGMIFSTPVGSTAYSLSAGGPIVAHGINSILVTPIAPHSFFNRSIIFSPSDKLKIKNNEDTELKISVDGRFFAAINSGEECVVTSSSKTLKMLSFNQNNNFSTLFKKMRILEDIK
ncbi:MAG: NAD(+)/NADH kinase [Clostridia bacterium]|nr:NAD(+)/NADH kinase [Clostridia bacterium]